ncbi:unnamed protein product [Heligmosomoides polygyrus]|uniref:Uncharacterized protein n=1 Tax=Heligmosomoides polygyrus TaxID=6339 RepID=A0A183GPQ9_HELPZ|nr:unnamed protein product [Heligmosomoides polygyrus]
MREKGAVEISRVRLTTVATIDATWRRATDTIRQAARLELGTTKPGRRKVGKQTWLWTDDVKSKVREKSLYHKYQKVKKAAEEAVAVAKATHYGDVHRKLESHDGERYFYRLANTRHCQTEDIEKFFGINDENGHLLMDRKKAFKRWRDYSEEISTVEFPHLAIPSVGFVRGLVQKITVKKKTEAALKKMKPCKATRPADLTADVWKSKLWYPAEWVAEFFNQVVKEKKIPEC